MSGVWCLVGVLSIDWRRVTGVWLQVSGCWLLVTGCWLLVGGWLLVVGGCFAGGGCWLLSQAGLAGCCVLVLLFGLLAQKAGLSETGVAAHVGVAVGNWF